MEVKNDGYVDYIGPANILNQPRIPMLSDAKERCDGAYEDHNLIIDSVKIILMEEHSSRYAVIFDNSISGKGYLADFIKLSMRNSLNINFFGLFLSKYSLDSKNLERLYYDYCPIIYAVVNMYYNPQAFKYFIKKCLERPTQGREFVLLTLALYYGQDHLRGIKINYLDIVTGMSKEDLLTRISYFSGHRYMAVNDPDYIPLRKLDYYTVVHYLIKLKAWDAAYYIINTLGYNNGEMLWTRFPRKMRQEINLLFKRKEKKRINDNKKIKEMVAGVFYSYYPNSNYDNIINNIITNYL